jgi:hypothetical protein
LEEAQQQTQLFPHSPPIFVRKQLLPIPCNLLTLTSRVSHHHNNSTFTPLIFSGIFYASNGRYKVSYVDSLFNCVSAMTVTGLATVNLSSLTGFQQALLFMLMCMGNPVSVLVSCITVLC